jgi:hypothetical protein
MNRPEHHYKYHKDGEGARILHEPIPPFLRELDPICSAAAKKKS